MLYPIVYDKKTYNFNNMGLGVLTDAKNVVIRKNINSADSLEFELLRTSDQWKYIKNENVIKADGQLYVIKLIDDGRDQRGSLYCRVSATHIWWEVAEKGTHITEVLAIGKSPQEIILEVFEDIKYNGLSFQLLDDSALELLGLEALTTLTDIEMDDPTPILVLSQIIENIGGEIYVDNFKFALVKQLGHDTGIKFSIDKNVQSIERSSNSMGLVTRLYPSGKDKISISSVNNGVAYIDSPYINDYASPLIGSKDYPDIESVTTLKERAEKEFSPDNYDRIDMPQVSYRCNVLELWKTKEYKSDKKINIGDYVRIYDKVLDIDVKVRVVEYNYYPYDPQKSLITLGNPPKTIVELLADLDKLNDNFESEVKEVVEIVQSEVFYETIIEVTRETILAAEVIDASFAFLDKTFTQTLQTNLVPFICKPNLLYNNDSYSWIDEIPTYDCQSSMMYGNIWPLIIVEGANQKFIERHLTPGDLSRLNSAQVQPLIIDGVQMYFTSLKAFEFLTPIDPKAKYPDITDENAEMFKVYVRRVEAEYIKQEFELELDGSLSTCNIINRYGTGDLSGNGIGFLKKDIDSFSLLYTLRQPVGVLSAGTETGIRLNDNAIPEFLDPVDGMWKVIGTGSGEGMNPGVTHILLSELPTQEQIDTFPENAIVLVYDSENPFEPIN